MTDRIQVVVDAPNNIQQAIETHLPYIAEQVLAVSIDLKDIDTRKNAHQGIIDGEDISISITVVNQWFVIDAWFILRLKETMK